MTPSDAIAAVALLVSVVTFFLSHRSQTASADRPVLVFSLFAGRRWRVDNVGTGPALNLTVADRGADGGSQKIVNCAPLAAGGQLNIPWLSGRHELVAVYTDIRNRTYTTVCGVNRNKFTSKNLFPDLKATRDQWLEDPIYAGRHEARFTESDLEGLDALQLLLLRSSIYAKHGYIFPAKEFLAYFSTQPGYRPLETRLDKVEAQFSLGETAEAHTILGVYYRHPHRRGGPFTELLDPATSPPVPPLLGSRPPSAAEPTPSAAS